jgi:hypothetical protein
MSTNRDLLKALSKPVDVRKLIDKLSFDLDGLEEASMDQPKLRLRAGRIRVQMMLRKSELKRHLASVIGKKSIHIRREHGNSYTATAIKNELGYDHDVRYAQRKLDEAEALEAYAGDLVDSFKERSIVLLNLSRIRSSEVSHELRAVKGQAEIAELSKRARRMRDRFEGESE